MSVLELLPLGAVDARLLQHLRSRLEAEFRVPCQVRSTLGGPEFAYHPERQQYHSSEVLLWLDRHLRQQTWRLLAVTPVDLYIPILTYVFGEARFGGRTAVVSLHRLRQEFYGLPQDDELLRERLLREAVHELGHTLGLHHCDDWQCVMSSSSAVEWIDLKGAARCDACRALCAAEVAR